MAKGRKNGCPVNVKDWDISIQDKAQSTETWLRIKGLTSMTYTTDGDTEDGSAATDNWEEPYVTKRSGSLSLEGKHLVDEATGAEDPGQAMLDDYATELGCDGDATLKVVDPYGKAMLLDAVVASSEISTDEDGDEKSWDLEQVGPAEMLPYVQVGSVALKNGDSAISTLSGAVGDAATVVTVAFTPANASNQRFRVRSSNKRVAAVGNVTADSFTVTPVGTGTATVTVTSVNGAKTATITVTVTAAT